MRTLLIPDIHLRSEALMQWLLWYEGQVDEVVFFGDFMDNYENPLGNTIAAQSICRQVSRVLDKRGNTKILASNHDMQYWFEAMPKCGGYDPAAKEVMRKLLPLKDLEGMLLLGFETQNWLLSHAGWRDEELVPLQDVNMGMIKLTDRTFTALDMYIIPELVQYGKDRGGRAEHGGPVTRDWQNLPLSSHFNQIVGHTFGPHPKIRGQNSVTHKANVCIDTGFDQIYWLQDGTLMTKRHNLSKVKLAEDAMIVFKGSNNLPWV
jgi:hypothetical protein